MDLHFINKPQTLVIIVSVNRHWPRANYIFTEILIQNS